MGKKGVQGPLTVKIVENTSLNVFLSCLKTDVRRLFYNGCRTSAGKKLEMARLCSKSLIEHIS